MRFKFHIWQVIFAISLFGTNLESKAEVLIGKVVGITDGDTITVLAQDNLEHKVRLMGIDAPEKSQEFGNQAKQVLSNYIYQREVSVDYKKIDKYQRKVGKVMLDKQDICLAMIELGMAWHYKDYEKEQLKTDRDLYRQAELKARESQIGLWQSSNPIAPSSFRGK
jgi:endonuclease YncB( thermonuclease family)